MNGSATSNNSHWIAVLGWIVAVPSLSLNWVIYQDYQDEKERLEKAEPVSG